ncbi:unnamed protein product [Symbiodinium natans]|uniref:Uncharacterized protein n=1 Tax=Symbiodinium natans TaxID=878477 RepID=A0A812QPY5_9DINO|nr:unnamed protein product [Symbiodinium natans]
MRQEAPALLPQQACTKECQRTKIHAEHAELGCRRLCRMGLMLDTRTLSEQLMQEEEARAIERRLALGMATVAVEGRWGARKMREETAEENTAPHGAETQLQEDGGVLDEDAPSVPTSMPCDEELQLARELPPRRNDVGGQRTLLRELLRSVSVHLAGKMFKLEGEMMAAVEAQAIAAWTSSSTSFVNVPAASVTAWLLEQGGPADLLLPESPGAMQGIGSTGIRKCPSFGKPTRLPKLLKLLSQYAVVCAQSSGGTETKCPTARGRQQERMRSQLDFEDCVSWVSWDLHIPFPTSVPCWPPLPDASAIQRLVEEKRQLKPSASLGPQQQSRLDSDASVREAAARALGCLGREGLAAIMGAGGLEHGDLEVRGCAALAAGWSGVAGIDYVDRLVSLLTDDANHPDKQSDEELLLRIRAAQALGARAELAGDPCLLALAGSLQNDPAEVVREACASSIGQIGCADKGLTKLARDCLLPGMDDQAAFVRDAVSSAMDALPQLGKEDFDMPQSAWQ